MISFKACIIQMVQAFFVYSHYHKIISSRHVLYPILFQAPKHSRNQGLNCG